MVETELLTVKQRASVAYTEATKAVEQDEEIQRMTEEELIEGVNRLRKERNAIILAHNYQLPVIQDLADFVGDSLELSRQAAKTDAKVIAFCGVHFMAETAAVLCPDKKVLIPDPEAGCSLAATVTAEQVRRWREKHPDAIVVAYINTTAEVKAEADYCCTSANAVEVVQALPSDREILFLPDMFLGAYVQRVTGKKMYLWPGECHVHAGIRPEHIQNLFERYPDADLLLHPECGCISQCMYSLAEGELPANRTFIYGTSSMIRHVRNSPVTTHLIGTEVGILHRMKKEAPGKRFVPIKEDAICEYMKTITLPKLYRALRDMVYEVTVPEDIAAGARRAIERMLEIV
ncbi:MAG: quinolinate synthase NadA [Candidatus Fervidibacter sp.]|uniref:quinolinate synthase NadA n=1 Tax=Candidatus Fervidibacter sp. TaxID=3100871 RepID=UPI00404A6A42